MKRTLMALGVVLALCGVAFADYDQAEYARRRAIYDQTREPGLAKDAPAAAVAAWEAARKSVGDYQWESLRTCTTQAAAVATISALYKSEYNPISIDQIAVRVLLHEAAKPVWGKAAFVESETIERVKNGIASASVILAAARDTNIFTDNGLRAGFRDKFCVDLYLRKDSPTGESVPYYFIGFMSSNQVRMEALRELHGSRIDLDLALRAFKPILDTPAGDGGEYGSYIAFAVKVYSEDKIQLRWALLPVRTALLVNLANTTLSAEERLKATEALKQLYLITDGLGLER